MNLTVTLILAGVSLALAVLCGVIGARPSRPLSAPRLAPWRFLMLLAFAVMVAALVHVVTLVRGT
ncbi:MAG TPA: hypothetical protein VG166_04485 [Caulobacteraceae bacterium]|jgi:hypothetical protein|nr:hypothetical protein [Caulobacteraceae bacterium]